MRITQELIQKSSQFLNAVGEFHIDLRGYKIPYIENLACTKDQFGTIDLTDNEITKIPALPALKRLKTLLLSDNRIAFIEIDFAKSCLGIENIVLVNNKISDFNQIDSLSCCKSLKRLVLTGNTVTKIENYRLYTISKIPSLKVLDFQKVTLKERIAAKEMFGEGTETITPIPRVKTQLSKEAKQRREQAMKLKMMIEKAETLEEIAQIEEEIKKGKYDDIMNELEEEEKADN